MYCTVTCKLIQHKSTTGQRSLPLVEQLHFEQKFTTAASTEQN
jgi:hypothetical protein